MSDAPLSHRVKAGVSDEVQTPPLDEKARSIGDDERVARVPAAAYVRMSTEHQKYSIDNQSAAIREYAQAHGFDIVRSYSDSARSGLTVDGRPALRQLIADVESGGADFRAVLVYDVSRWGRFQDVDESAYYEYTCRRAGVSLHYCAELFQNAADAFSSILKVMKRAMAGEYSRELSAKVFASQCRLAELGYHQGGRAGFGLRRELHDEAGVPKAILQTGERKYNRCERTVLVPGPPEETETIRLIFELFAVRGMSVMQIACALNEEGRTGTSALWSANLVRNVLTNEKFAGVNVWNASSGKLKSRRTRNEPGKVVRVQNALAPVVHQELFDSAQAAMARRQRNHSEEAMLERLKDLCRKHGEVTYTRVAETHGKAEASRYGKIFGSLDAAAKAAGVPFQRERYRSEINRQLRLARMEVIAALKRGIRRSGGDATFKGRFLLVNSTFTVAIIAMKSFETPAKEIQWRRFVRRDRAADIIVVARLKPVGPSIQDFCILPGGEVSTHVLRLTRCRDRLTDCYRFDDMSILFDLAGGGRQRPSHENI